MDGTGVSSYGGGRVPLVLNPGEPNSTQTPFLHREGRVKSGGYEFNREMAGRDFRRSALLGRHDGLERPSCGSRKDSSAKWIFDKLVAMEEELPLRCCLISH